MEVGIHFEANHKRFRLVSEKDWTVALAKCKDHLKWRLKRKMLYGVYTEANLGADPFDHYVSLAYEKLLAGHWEWKEGRTLPEQLIRIMDSEMSKEVERKHTSAHLSSNKYPGDDKLDFYTTEPGESDEMQKTINEAKLYAIAKACQGDDQLEFIIEALKEGKKRSEIAELLEIQPRQFDKLREKIIRRINSIED